MRGDEALASTLMTARSVAGIATDEARRQEAPVAQVHVDRERLVDDVVVREDRAVGREDDARAGAARDGRVAAPPRRASGASGRALSSRAVTSICTTLGLTLLGDVDERIGQALARFEPATVGPALERGAARRRRARGAAWPASGCCANASDGDQTKRVAMQRRACAESSRTSDS